MRQYFLVLILNCVLWQVQTRFHTMDFGALLVLLLCPCCLSIPILHVMEEEIASDLNTNLGKFHSKTGRRPSFVVLDLNRSDKLTILRRMQDAQEPFGENTQIPIVFAVGIGAMTALIYIIRRLIKVFQTEFHDFTTVKI